MGSTVGERSGEGFISRENCFHYLSGNDAFGCILGAGFNVSIRRVKVKTESKSTFVC